MLHNILRQRGEECPPDDPELILPAPWDELLMRGQMNRIPMEAPLGRNAARDELINDYFQSLL